MKTDSEKLAYAMATLQAIVNLGTMPSSSVTQTTSVARYALAELNKDENK